MSPRRRWLALGVLALGGALVTTTVASAGKTEVVLHIALVPGVRGLVLDVERERRVVAHLEWSYQPQSPVEQEVHLALPAGDYSAVAHARGAGRDPAPLPLHVGDAGPVRAELRIE